MERGAKLTSLGSSILLVFSVPAAYNSLSNQFSFLVWTMQMILLLALFCFRVILYFFIFFLHFLEIFILEVEASDHEIEWQAKSVNQQNKTSHTGHLGSADVWVGCPCACVWAIWNYFASCLNIICWRSHSLTCSSNPNVGKQSKQTSNQNNAIIYFQWTLMISSHIRYSFSEW